MPARKAALTTRHMMRTALTGVSWSIAKTDYLRCCGHGQHQANLVECGVIIQSQGLRRVPPHYPDVQPVSRTEAGNVAVVTDGRSNACGPQRLSVAWLDVFTKISGRQSGSTSRCSCFPKAPMSTRSVVGAHRPRALDRASIKLVQTPEEGDVKTPLESSDVYLQLSSPLLAEALCH